MRRSAFFYPFCAFAILSWWMVVFHQSIAEEERPVSTPPPPKTNYASGGIPEDFVQLPKREDVQKALCGDASSQIFQIESLTQQAQILKGLGLKGAASLTDQEFAIARLISYYLSKGLKTFPFQPSHVVDALGLPVVVSNAPQKIFPHTWGAAEISLALLPSNKIASLPAGFAVYNTTFPSSKIEAIGQSPSQEVGEYLLMNPIDLAIVSSIYSQPSTVDSLKQNNIPTYATNEINSIDAMREEVENIGTLCHETLRAKLLSLYCKALAHTLDNYNLYYKTAEKKILITHLYSRFNLPGNRSLTGNLLQRMGISTAITLSSSEEKEKYQRPITTEQIVHFAPAIWVVFNNHPEKTLSYLQSLPAASQVPAVQNKKVYILSESLQLSVSQLHLLAYYDLTNSVATPHEP